ncbi:hypothetical protein [Actinoplanes sp. NPDC049802]|uniref:hypothetical protein n=1 Tax=Actinoplanes sp. NPDC049802 TaxID=3154742 RepID=UPI0033F9D892
MAERLLQPELGAALRREAERHTPDRTAMLNRIARRRAEPVRDRWAFSLRPVAAAASVVATIVVGFTGIKLAGDRPVPAPAATEGASPPSPSPSPSRTSREKSAGPTRKVERGAPAGSGTTPVAPVWKPVDGFLSSSAVIDGHSVGTWAQGNVTLTTTEPVTELDVVIGVARTGGVREAGKWTSIPESMISMAVTGEKDVLYYRFTLKPGGTLAPGSYVFAAQYLHEGERDPGGDNYGAVAGAGTRKAAVTGAFPPG